MHAPSLIDFTLPDPPQTWLVVFLNPPEPPREAPWQNRLLGQALKLLRPGFRHVLAVAPLPTGGWLICNPGSCFLGTGVIHGPMPLSHIRNGVLQGNARCIAMTARRPNRIRLRGLFTCVNVIAHLVGVDCSPFTTPWRFHRRIAAMQQ